MSFTSFCKKYDYNFFLFSKIFFPFHCLEIPMYRGFDLVKELTQPNYQQHLVAKALQKDFSESEKVIINTIEKNLNETVH